MTRVSHGDIRGRTRWEGQTETLPDDSHRLWRDGYEVEFFHPKQIDPGLAKDALNALPKFSSPQRVRLVLTGDLNRSLQKHDERHDPSFTRTRTTGVVGGKTLIHQDGTAHLLIDAELFRTGAQGSDRGSLLRRLLRHEGYHVVLGERQEDTASIFRRVVPSNARAYYLGIAAIALEEFRIERAVWEEGYETSGRSEGLVQILQEARRNFRDAVRMRYPDEPIDRTFNSSLREFNQLSTHLAYIAAEPADVRDPSVAQAMSHELWDRIIGEAWEDLERLLEPVADARNPIGEAVDEVARALTNQHEAWFAHIGFRIEDTDNGPYFRVLRHDF